MKTIIAGGRDYEFTPDDLDYLDRLHSVQKITEVVSGGAKGADWWGEYWAKSRGIPVNVFPADWVRNGKAAGPMRNREMAAYADRAILFPGGRGTDSMRNEAKARGIPILEPYAT